MAESDESSPEHFVQRNRVHSYSDDSEVEEAVKLDLGLGGPSTSMPCNTTSPASPDLAGSSRAKREDASSFSFKHFLRYDMNNYQNLGARPKVYCDGRPITSISDLDLHQITMGKQTRIVPEFSSALPDFVQDHLVIEQSYLGNNSMDLPDFTPNRTNSNINRLNVDNIRENENSNSNNSSTLDLTSRNQPILPLDLPITSENQATTSRSCPVTADAGTSKILPDFLTDGPVRSQQSNEIANNQNPDREVDRLRIEMENLRRELGLERTRGDRLEEQLEELQTNNSEQNLKVSLMQSQSNLERSKRQVDSLEKTVLKLRKELKAVTTELNMVKTGSYNLQGEASGGGPSGNCIQNAKENPKLAKELRAAADSAEFSLRQLLKGVNNLRLLANSVENTNTLEETSFNSYPANNQEEEHL